ncbi:hypothetical protein SCLCIDRAFT_322515 [Scleroderma citrinum Foug A]|uniref:Uncharacterized protein n=1 Tax=Scleroderma citrinum Foug A TaxID=1036808 RepID=A0A0C3EDP4_9AGAM|nr:hypothetical protein SCLCIDRAFT_322515 [Scleroderma citrinum Foug A]
MDQVREMPYSWQIPLWSRGAVHLLIFSVPSVNLVPPNIPLGHYYCSTTSAAACVLPPTFLSVHTSTYQVPAEGPSVNVNTTW